MTGPDADHGADPTTSEGSRRTIVTIRTPAGIGHVFEVRQEDRVDQTAQAAVDHFVAHSQLAAGNYRLVLIREGQPAEMPETARLEDFNVTDGDVLSLINKDPQVDA
jgi:hypothetical protein